MLSCILIIRTIILHQLNTPIIIPLPDNPAPEKDIIDCIPSPPPERQSWAAFGTGPGTRVYGYPSKGGYYRLDDCLGIELDFLGLDRFNVTRHPPESDPEWQAKEDAHLRHLGATWVKYHDDDFWFTVEGPEDSDPYTKVGWPAAGGVWVLHITYGEAWKRGAAILYNARDMEERCELIKRLGGEFFEDPNDCPYLDLS
ncbi:hypothetical protein BO94DRAFT_470594 [Aspergillus sclerotioniger CBS 115572]|uniref:Uncharacterized protein n=1 Tax=Aspergillus sclerotioniger CBS 115572 TaxID=1450535 RepID=A0A317W6H0_9EURO|nr:hypothetical protein BO94DRAFT_470594 [Aspergillus sclerotioniger CBS 115572]PWY80847.1 hypothetical protein BO94DRAFT_470594 [Aspergillus sclerotioniger CBS 115572]